MHQTKRSIFIDTLRWFSAFLVVSGHIRSVLFSDYMPSITQPLIKAFYFVTGFGHQAVIVFFVLSGYLVGGSVITQLKYGTFQLKKYAINRFTRLYAVLILALILTFVFDKIGSFINTTGVYTSINDLTSLAQGPIFRDDLKHLICSALMLQTIVLPPLGSNGPLWSLANEFWYYIIFPVIAGVFYIKNNYLQSIIYPMIILLFFYFMPFDICLYLLIWMMGLIPYFVKKQSRWLKYVSVIAILGLLISNRLLNIGTFSDFALALFIALCISTYDNAAKVSRSKNKHQFLASFSYSLYLIHYPLQLLVLVIINEYITPAIKIAPSITTFMIYGACLLICYLLSYLVATFTEYQTDRLRSCLQKL